MQQNKSYKDILIINAQKLGKALRHLSYSYNKVSMMSHEVSELDEEALETWESFAARFSCVADIFLTRFIRAYVLYNDPGFEGTLRDFVNQAEKLNMIEDARAWMAIRELRNIAAHDYSEEDLNQFFARLKLEAPRLLRIQELLDAFNPN